MDRRIIIGYDPEHGGLDPVRLGRQLADSMGAEAIVVASLPWPEYLMSHKDLQEQVELEMKPRFDIVREEFGDRPVTTRAVPGRSGSRALHEAADDARASLIVIGSSHRGPIGRTLAGSTGDSLMHGAPCGIAIAPRSYAEREDADLKRVAVAFDGSPESWTALETAIGLAEHLGGELTVLTVADYLSYGYSTTWSVFTAGELDDAERREKRRLLETGLGRIPETLPSNGRVLIGDAGVELAEASSEYDLMLTGSRGYGPLRRTILGSTTRQLVAGSSCPVLVLPRAVGSDPLGFHTRRSAAHPRG
jgi:nucleotide-binding universal stress UspA family protein